MYQGSLSRDSDLDQAKPENWNDLDQCFGYVAFFLQKLKKTSKISSKFTIFIAVSLKF